MLTASCREMFPCKRCQYKVSPKAIDDEARSQCTLQAIKKCKKVVDFGAELLHERKQREKQKRYG
jgi:hypothetical protein